MKVALITDTHLGISNDHPVQVYNIDRFFEWFWEYVKQNDITHVFHLGDIVDNRTRISFLALEQMRRCIIDPVKRTGVEFWAIVGNHDVAYRTTNEISCASLLEDKDGIKILSEPKDLVLPDGTVCAFLPWINRNNHDQAVKFLRDSQAKYVFGHLEIKGAQMMRGTVSEHGEEATLFSRFPAVFTGHYHHKNSYGNIHYIGNTCQFNWGDWGEQRGFTLLDTETGYFELVENPFSPFQKLYYNDVENNYEDLSFLDKFDYNNLLIKVIVVQKQNPFYLDRYVTKLTEKGAYSVTVVEHDSVEFTDENSATEEDIAEFKADTLAILDEFVQTTAMSDEQTTRVKSIMKQLYAEAQTRELVS